MDNRCKYLAKLMTRDGYEVVDNQDKLPSCMIVYLGVDGKDCKQDDFAFGSVVFTLLKNQRLEYPLRRNILSRAFLLSALPNRICCISSSVTSLVSFNSK